MVKFSNPQKSNSIPFKTLNTNNYVLNQIQRNTQESFSKVSELFSSINLCLYEQNFTKTIAQNSFFSFSNKINDEFGVYDLSTGIFKCPKDSIYFFSGYLNLGITAGQTSYISLYKNGSDYARVWYGENSSTSVNPQFNCCFNLKAGDEIKLFWSSSDVNPVNFGSNTLIANQFFIRW